jgi:hypothetical protein
MMQANHCVCNWATAEGLLFFPIAASRLSGDPIGAGATERLEVVVCRLSALAGEAGV